ncbi:MAG: KamA family radical SAM protein [Candidatus Krumholzibacteria bacterium]|nr:KamA family radical SAM protein [Candidatus Krumholzibacteria bacterium]
MRDKTYKPKYLTRLEQIPQLSDEERKRLRPVHDEFVFRTNDYYNSLIDWNDPDDPIRRLVIPDVRELDGWGRLDASNEASYKRVPGLEHKYDSVALLLVNDVCGAYCRFCFRKRLFMNGNDEVVRDVSEGIAYIREHPEIAEVLLTGGDPLLVSTRKLGNIIGRLREIDHVEIIRIGSKIPAFNPFRILNDPTLAEIFRRYSLPHKRIYVMAQFNHPRELTPEAIEGLHVLRQAGVIIVNQTPMIAGVNDDPDTLSELFRKCAAVGVPPYYVFQCRPTLGNRIYSVPVERAYEIFETAKMRCSGLAKRARLVMSHETGKIEIAGLTDRHVVFKYHRAADPDLAGRVYIFRRNPRATWFDDYHAVVEASGLENPYGSAINEAGSATGDGGEVAGEQGRLRFPR